MLILSCIYLGTSCQIPQKLRTYIVITHPEMILQDEKNDRKYNAVVEAWPVANLFLFCVFAVKTLRSYMPFDLVTLSGNSSWVWTNKGIDKSVFTYFKDSVSHFNIFFFCPSYLIAKMN